MNLLRTLLMVLIAMRLLMPPGICACKWSSPAARFLIALTQSDRQIPVEEQSENDDDHDAGCPASPLAAGMGVAPPCDPFPTPGLALELAHVTQTALLFCYLPSEPVDSIHFNGPATPLYVTIRALLL